MRVAMLETSGPKAQDDYVAFKQGQRAPLYDPAEAEALAFSLLGAAQKARAARLAHGPSERPQERREPDAEERIV